LDTYVTSDMTGGWDRQTNARPAKVQCVSPDKITDRHLGAKSSNRGPCRHGQLFQNRYAIKLVAHARHYVHQEPF